MLTPALIYRIPPRDFLGLIGASLCVGAAVAVGQAEIPMSVRIEWSIPFFVADLFLRIPLVAYLPFRWHGWLPNAVAGAASWSAYQIGEMAALTVLAPKGGATGAHFSFYLVLIPVLIIAIYGVLGGIATVFCQIAVRLFIVRSVRQIGGLCGYCGYDLRLPAVSTLARCPECGRPPSPVRRGIQPIQWVIATVGLGIILLAIVRFSLGETDLRDRLRSLGSPITGPVSIYVNDPSGAFHGTPAAGSFVASREARCGAIVAITLCGEDDVPRGQIQAAYIDEADGEVKALWPPIVCDLSSRELELIERGSLGRELADRVLEASKGVPKRSAGGPLRTMPELEPWLQGLLQRDARGTSTLGS